MRVARYDARGNKVKPANHRHRIHPNFDTTRFRADVSKYIEKYGLMKCDVAYVAGIDKSTFYRFMSDEVQASLMVVSAVSLACNLSLDTYRLPLPDLESLDNSRGGWIG